jgi:hypothetical protein
MSRTRPSIAVLIGLAGLILIVQASLAVAQDDEKILDFDTMVGVQGAFVGATNPIRGVNGGGVAWMLEKGEGRLSTAGHLDVEVEGLVIASGPNTGNNPVSSFRAIVSCLTSDGGTRNLTTAAFPATTGPASEGGGDSRITADLELPQPCIAPIVFVTSPGGSWFATTGN